MIAVQVADAIGVLVDQTDKALLEGGPRRISPFFIPSAIINLAAGQVSIRFGAKGPNSATCTACCTSSQFVHIEPDETDTLAHVVTALDGIEGVDNLTPGVGGVDLETVDEVRANAPFAFRPRVLPAESATGGPNAPGVVGAGPGDRAARPDGTSLRRAVTPADYAAVLEVGDDVQRASASIRWTGSWSTVSIMVDLAGGGPLTPADEARLRARLRWGRLSADAGAVETGVGGDGLAGRPSAGDVP